MNPNSDLNQIRAANRQAWEDMSVASRLGTVGLTAVSLSASALTFSEFC